MRPYSIHVKCAFVLLSDIWAGFSTNHRERWRDFHCSLDQLFLIRGNFILKDFGTVLRRSGRGRNKKGGGWSVRISRIEFIKSLICGGVSVFWDLIAREKLFQPLASESTMSFLSNSAAVCWGIPVAFLEYHFPVASCQRLM